jgi:hypothetical protein
VVLDLVQPPATRGETRETPVQVDLPIQVRSVNAQDRLLVSQVHYSFGMYK